MIGKVTFALTRKEADTYRTQGLAQEALDICRKASSASPRLPEELKAAIECQLREIEQEIGTGGPEEREALADEQIAVIKQGWCGNATVEEMWTCALDFLRLGHFRHALEELEMLSRIPGARQRLSGAYAACLVHLHDPETMACAADAMARKGIRDSRAAIAFQMAIAQKALAWGYLEHARSLLRHISRRYRGLPAEISDRLFALAGESGESMSPPPPKGGGRPGRLNEKLAQPSSISKT